MRFSTRIIALLLAAALPACNCGSSVPKVVQHPKNNGEACTADSDCQSGLCTTLPGASGPTCQQPCDDGCPAGDRCIQTGTSNGKTTYACAADPGKLCATCTSDSDCGYPGDACLQSGDVVACGQDCSGDGVCPSGYTCTSAARPNGTTALRQCVPTSGTCACTEKSRGQTRPCEHTNSYGTCQGVEICDPAQGYTGCSALVPAPEVCDGVDNDCNGNVDDGLGQTTCGYGACQVTVDNCVEGHVNLCKPDMTKATPETCNGKDDDCDGVIDNGFDLNNDVNNCGACGRACPSQNGTPECQTGGFCSITCNSGFDDCDHNIVNGCETNLDTDVKNCGYCGNTCSYANAAPECDAGACQMGACASGYYDLDHNPANGCEYACQFLADSDIPDVTSFPDGGVGFTDTNCDGLDGEVDGGIFVAPNGDDNNPGTMAQPFRTIQHAINVAASLSGGTTPMSVYLASGTYSGTITLASNVSLYGGYIVAPVWQRSLSAATTLTGGNPVIVGNGVHDVTVQLVNVSGEPASTPSGSSIAVQLVNSTNMLFDHVNVTGNDGENGLDGADGNQGNDGSIGADGQQGFEDSSAWLCSGDGNPPGPSGGPGGKNSTCPAANGGAGGAAGLSGNSGSPGSPSAGGAAGGAPVASGRGDQAAPLNANGANGGPGSTTDGSPGSALGSFTATAYVAASGVDGKDGTPGVGGGGGGGGGGGTNDCDSWGSGAGGGGAGGCGGSKGTAGSGGGASIAIWLYDTQLTAIDCDIAAGNGGAGGKGGKGGAGGAGAGGGISPYGSSDSQDDGSLGGLGGHGGNGGRGGNGGGGGGGPSFGVLKLNGSSIDAQGCSIIPGQAGLGGVNPATGASFNGKNGLAQAVYSG